MINVRPSQDNRTRGVDNPELRDRISVIEKKRVQDFIQHKSLAGGRWNTFSHCEQLAHVGSEVSRALNWPQKQNERFRLNAFERALELMDLTLDDPKNRTRARELCRLRESLVDYFQGTNEFGSTPADMRRYFDAFAYAARRNR